MRRSTLNVSVIALAAFAALVLTVTRRTPGEVTEFTIEPPRARAAPGERGPSQYDLSALAVFNLTMLRIQDNYVDPQRIDPGRMLVRALDSVQFNIPEVLVIPSPARGEVEVVVNDQRRTFSTADVDSPWRLARRLSKVFRFIEDNMNAGAELADVEYAAVNGMLATLDPHSVLLDPEAAREMDVSTSGKFGGLGIVVRVIDRKLTVVRPMKGTPAAERGLRAGDHIAKIDGEPTQNLTLNEAVDRMRGDPGTPVSLVIERKDVAEAFRVDLVRAVIRVESVVSGMLDKGVGYIRIKQFSSSTSKEVEAAQDALRVKGATSWLLDLRGNPGGLLEQAIAVADQFVESGTLVTTVSGREREPRRAEDGDGDAASPVVVLVNGGSASASEVVAGALKNLDRALIVGSRTFGKGSVQVLYDNDDGSKLKMTIAEYLTPGDRSIQSVGIVPDLALQRMLVPAKNDAVGDWLRLLSPTRTWSEADYDAHITSRYARDTDRPAHELPYVYQRPARGADGASTTTPPPGDDDEGDDLDDVVVDWEVATARDLLATVAGNTRTEQLAAVAGFVSRVRAAEEKALVERLAALGVDWSAPPAEQAAAPALAATVTLSPTGEAHAGDEVVVTGTVTNTGAGDAWRVHARVLSDDPVFEDAELAFGRVPAGGKATFTTRVRVPADAADRVDRLRFAFTEARGAAVDAAPVDLRVVAAPRPRFDYAYHRVDDGNGDGLVQPGERHRLIVSLRNAGVGSSRDTTVVLRNASGDAVELEGSRRELGELSPGATQTVSFDFRVTQAVGDEVVVELMAWDGDLGVSAGEKLRLPVRAPITSEAARGTVEVTRAAELRDAASPDAVVVHAAARGERFAALATVGSYTKVELAPGRPAFVPTSSVARSRKAAGATPPVRWKVTPPTVAVTPPTQPTTAETWRLTGTATDETHVEDVYVFVSNAGAKIDDRKVYYRSNRGGERETTQEFAADIPLWPGSNQVTVVARESAGVSSSVTFHVFRDGPAK